ncbi:hypothetical protein C1646_750852 [Rhizophagus diaphanus]|nr:hypothetical protein C1646_750852 [Rhizophagus diaphanus] [Rhizophagus sp. MUCL 43196]
MLKENACNLLNLKSFQIDVLFKCVQGAMNEFEINCYDKDYKLKITQQHIRFHHINNEGWGYILGDLNAAQAKGLELALVDIYPSLEWKDHLTYIFKSYIIHFNRNIKNKPFKNSIKQLMYSIPDATSAEEVYNFLNEIEKTEEPEIKIDNRHKKISITYDNTGVPYTRRDRSKKSVECPKSIQKEVKGKQSEKKVVIDLSINASSSKISKRKEAFSGSKNIKDTKKRRVEQENDPPVDDKRVERTKNGTTRTCYY